MINSAQQFLSESADKIVHKLSGLCHEESGVVVRQSARKLSDQVGEFLKETFSGIFTCCDVAE